ncbi:MAG: GHKL domain-containing protein [Clostridiales bacterium]|nr:GHKL domain-containing protein [Clostridiales bacterium]
MPFLKKQHVTTVGSLLGLCVLLSTMLFSSLAYKEAEQIQWTMLFLLFIFILFLFLFIWWRNQLQRTYLEQLRKRDIKRLEDELQDCQNTITSLKEENQKLAKLIHRDNKQVAALELAVETFLSTPFEEKESQKKAGDKLLLELQKENCGRKQMVFDLSKPENLSFTDILSVNCLLNYMVHKGQTDSISLEVSLTGNIHYFLEEIMEEQDFLTLVADLLENALIATRHGKGTQILIHIGVINECYSISVWDTGIPFTKETLLHFGRKQYTTHKKDGGSGIGLMSTYELLQKYQASIQIEEFTGKETMYQKKVSILFNGNCEYHLHTNRDKKELSYLHQRKDLHIIYET